MSPHKVVAIVQARMGSSRLPGKVLADVGGKSMLARVVCRVARASQIDQTVVATSESPADEAIVGECCRLGIPFFRGSENDVLDRFHQAATASQADIVVRITADCPLIDPGVTDRVVRAMLDQMPDYASNTLQRTYPRGLDTEVVTLSALGRASREATEPYERIHVMPYLYRHPKRFRLLAVTHEQDLSDGRWTVDSPEDLAFVRAVYRRMDDRDTFSWHDVLHQIASEPSLADLNRHVRQKHLVEG